MSKKDRNPFKQLNNTPFQSPRAKPKWASYQVNGETRKSQAEIITAVQMRKRT
ncbi:hypothetical protein HNQ94_003583 [Salirhabdus euzebyi]|uniref:YpzG family protein n=1 Tax=Salirhabdus euzebyi TaxID=394506 RepID=A0A841Q9I8_9BACI|nr:YpzG family protein [Salirhabdus euzebyi]MBB6455088.1 hypothetical protein [Salirhabdus euzebyi]